MNNKMSIIMLMFFAAVLSGCKTSYQHPIEDVDLVEVSYDAVETLLKKPANRSLKTR